MLALLGLLVAAAVPVRSEERVVVQAGAQYQANPLSRVLFGGQWRDLWTTPIEVPVLDLAHFDGGLSPSREGGGLQTKNLHLESANGRTWVFRSVDKDMGRMADPEVRDTLVMNIFQDLTSTSNPMAALVVSALLDAAGVLHAEPQLMVMPDDPRLGEFRKRFAGVLGMIEQRIEKDLPGADKVASTPQLIDRLESHAREQVDARALLRARLMDVFIGDWDRHIDQWRWVRFEEGGHQSWHPVPRDRDQAFSRVDGLFPSVGEYYTKQLASFRSSYPPIEKLTYAGRFIDRRFLVRLDKAEWMAVAADLKARLTDQVIADAVRRLPPEAYAKRSQDLEQTLRSRRDRLMEAADAYYRLLAEYPDVYCTTGADEVAIARQPDGSVEVRFLPRAADADPPFFRRRFLRDETREIRIYLLGGEDRVEASGPLGDAIRVRLVAASGEERFIDRSVAPAQAWEVRRTATSLHHFQGTVDAGPETAVDRSPPPAQKEGTAKYEPPRDWGSDWLLFPQLSYDINRGLVAGARAVYTRYGFELNPFSSEHNLSAAWATGLNEPRLEYRGEFRTRSPLRGLLYVYYSGMDAIAFFGMGNDTVRDAARFDEGYYGARQKKLIVHPFLEAAIAGPLRARAGLLVERATNEVAAPFAATGRYGFATMALGSGEIGLAFESRSGSLTAARGFEFQVTARHYPRLFDNQSSFTKMRAEAKLLAGATVLTDVLLTLRVAGEKNWGRYPYFEAAFIGGAASSPALDLTGATSGNLLRGYDLNRFAGDAALVANADLRVALGSYVAILPFRYGLLGLLDTGRVWLAGETSKTWHMGAGGGLWLMLRAVGPTFEYVSTFSAVMVRSDERTTFYLASGFGI